MLKNCLKFYNLGNKSKLDSFKANNQAFCIIYYFFKPKTKVVFKKYIKKYKKEFLETYIMEHIERYIQKNIYKMIYGGIYREIYRIIWGKTM